MDTRGKPNRNMTILSRAADALKYWGRECEREKSGQRFGVSSFQNVDFVVNIALAINVSGHRYCSRRFIVLLPVIFIQLSQRPYYVLALWV